MTELSLSDSEQSLIKTYVPQNVFIIYGTLAPGKPNHSKVEHIKGEWKSAVIKGGRLESKGWGSKMGYDGFVPVPDPEQKMDIAAQILFSDELTKHWESLDQFEGEGYRRILARYELADGHKGVGYVYAINEK
ncbi:gamma-glutamylcyclotransferase [Dyadobacter flavalbus]|uniref:Gamma-glutamylcyclotransferase n=2 Tax=Dyadobacter flavalbus TaxID=2579942 RepID=A0A5M8QTT8_9BACT|nr:gamma-glutamylcyclotransferase [Dyadobacter flavalbus]